MNWMHKTGGTYWYAITGELLEKDNMKVHCQFENNGAGGKFLHDTHSHTTSAPLKEHLWI